jgi:hypothetical protein
LSLPSREKASVAGAEFSEKGDPRFKHHFVEQKVQQQNIQHQRGNEKSSYDLVAGSRRFFIDLNPLICQGGQSLRLFSLIENFRDHLC